MQPKRKSTFFFLLFASFVYVFFFVVVQKFNLSSFFFENAYIQLTSIAFVLVFYLLDCRSDCLRVFVGHWDRSEHTHTHIQHPASTFQHSR